MDLQRLEFYVSRMRNLVTFLRTKATIVAFVAKGFVYSYYNETFQVAGMNK